MKMKLMLLPVIASSMFLSGCASLLAGGPLISVSSSGRDSGTYVDSGAYDDSTERATWEADARMDDWLNQQQAQQQQDMANQMANDASNAAAAAAAANAAAINAALNP